MGELRPLERLRSIKLKLSIVIVTAVLVTLVVNEVGLNLNFKPPFRFAVAALLALVMVQVLARGMTRPLRDMEKGAAAMAAGDLDRRVMTSSVDEVGRLAAAFNHMAAELAEVDRQRRDLVANVSHELRTPISSLRATLENLVDGVTPADPALLASMLAQVERLQRLVSQLLDLARLESGRSPLHLGTVRIAALLTDVAEEVARSGSTSVVRVTVDPSKLTVVADRERLHQVVANLVENAARYSPAGAPVDVEAVGLGEQGVELTVTDRGPGIPAEDRSRVFERFHRLDHARTRDGGGAGLGLAIVRWIVDLHGGTIRADAGPDGAGGCRMIVRLPVRATAISRPLPEPAPAPAAP
jgi:signal transduction histidine kinase